MDREGVHHRAYLLTNAELLASDFGDVLDTNIEIGVTWNDRLTRSIALARWDTEMIELGGKLYPRVFAQQRPGVIAHEVCHLIAWERFGTEVPDHGLEWRSLMRLLGFEGTVMLTSCKKGGLKWPINRAPRERHSG